MYKMQQTIKEEIHFTGYGIHTGVKTNMTLKSSKENSGVKFIRTDLNGMPEVKADVDYVFIERSMMCDNSVFAYTCLDEDDYSDVE